MPKSSAPRSVWLPLAIGVLAISTAATLVRVADAPALALAFWRNALGAVVLAPFAIRVGLDAAVRHRGRVLAAGAALAVHFALFLGALSFTTVASAVVLVTMTPVVVGVVALLRGTEVPAPRQWMGISLAVGGAAVIAVADAPGVTSPNPALGNAMALGGAAAGAVYLLIGRDLRRYLAVSVYAGSVYAVAAVLLAVASLATATPLFGPWNTTTWLAILGLTVGPQLLGHTVFNALLVRLSANVVALVTLAEPLGAAILAAVVLAETPTAGFWFGAPLILAGVYLGVATGAHRVVRPSSASSA